MNYLASHSLDLAKTPNVPVRIHTCSNTVKMGLQVDFKEGPPKCSACAPNIFSYAPSEKTHHNCLDTVHVQFTRLLSQHTPVFHQLGLVDSIRESTLSVIHLFFTA